MIRRVKRGAMALSFLSLLVVLVLWPISYWRVFEFYWSRQGRDGVRDTYIFAENGLLWVSDFPAYFETKLEKGFTVKHDEPNRRQEGTFTAGIGGFAEWEGWNFWGLQYWEFNNWFWIHYSAAVPLWYFGIPGLLLCAAKTIGYARKRRRLLHGYCSQCGYDLRASPERCPECGEEQNSLKSPRRREINGTLNEWH